MKNLRGSSDGQVVKVPGDESQAEYHLDTVGLSDISELTEHISFFSFFFLFSCRPRDSAIPPIIVSANHGICLDSLHVSGSVINPVMGTFHVLLQVAFPLARVRALWVLTFEFVRYRAMLVIEMPVTLLFGWPPMLVVLARRLAAFPRP